MFLNPFAAAGHILSSTEAAMLGQRHDEAKVRAVPLDDARLIARIVDGDRRAFEALYRAYYPRLSHFILRMVRRPQVAEEVFNDTLMIVWNRAATYNGQSKVSTWIFAIAYRRALSALRRQDEPMEDLSPEQQKSDEPGPEQQLDRRQVRETLSSVMRDLSHDHRTVVDLAYFHEMGYREIAEIMDCPVDTVKTRMFHARRNLRAALAGELTDWL
jgi:RNA polymerase sigma-70 factor (ECF subfamily)